MMKTANPESRLKERTLSEAVKERRATPSFDGTRVPADVLDTILRAGLESPSGFNLQPWRFVVVQEPEQKKRLREAAMNQSKVEEAGAVIVFCGDLKGSTSEGLDQVLAESAEHGFTDEQNQKAKAGILKTFSGTPGNAMGLAPDFAVWLNRHVMISLTTMMWMAETLGFDTAPMEGFYEDKVRATLGIPDHVRVVALLAIGRRKGEDKRYSGRHKLEEVCFMEKWK
jgi:nitroreductase